MGNSPLVNFTRISPNRNSPRRDKIRKITIHHVAGNVTVERLGEIFAPASRKASSNYGIGTDGRVGMYVEEKDRSWASSNADNDHQAITIEVANNGGAPNWPVSDTALAMLIDLCVDICKRNGIERLNFTGDRNGNVTLHKMFAATLCPGPYLESKIPYIVAEANKRIASPPKGEEGMSYTDRPGANYLLYPLQRGETLSQIAPRFGTTWQHIRDVNKIADVTKIPAGALLWVPIPKGSAAHLEAELLAKDKVIEAANNDLRIVRADMKRINDLAKKYV